MTLEEFIESVTREAQDRTGMEDVCVNNIALFYPDAFEEAVEYCEMVTTGEFYEYWDEEEGPLEACHEKEVPKGY